MPTPAPTPVVMYNLNTSVNPPGSGTITPSSGSYESGRTVGLWVTPNTGYKFVGCHAEQPSSWSPFYFTESGNVVTVTMPDHDVMIVANFEVPQYSVTVSTNPPGYGLVCSAGGCWFGVRYFNYGTSLTFTTTPVNGYQFVSWSGDVTGTNPSITITMDSNKNIVANFSPIPAPTPTPVHYYTVTTVSSPSYGGTISPSTPSVVGGTTLTFTATPAPGYQFVSWWADVSGTNPSVTLTVYSNAQVGANFEPIPFPTLTPTPTS